MPDAILVADDEAVLQRLLSRVLERAGFEVVVAGDGATAAAAVEKEPERFAAVVLDATLAPRGAAETLRVLLARRAGPGVVLMSGADLDRELRAALLRCGGVFLSKPFGPETLVAAVRRAVDAREG